MIVSMIAVVFAAWVVAMLIAYLCDDQAHGRRTGGDL